MTTQVCQASFLLSTGEVVDMKTTVTDGASTELLTSTDYSVSAVSIGTYGEGKVITQILSPPTFATAGCWAYVNRRGAILCALPIATAGVQSEPSAMPLNFVLQAGDTIQVKSRVAANRTFAYSCITAQGVHAIFDGLPTGAGSTDLNHILSGQSLGSSLTNQSVAVHWATSIDMAKLDSGSGMYALNDRGLPIGSCVAVNPANLQPVGNSFGLYAIGLNFVARVTTNA